MLSSVIYAGNVNSLPISAAEIEQLDTLHHRFSNRFHQQLLDRELISTQVYSHVKELADVVSQYTDNENKIVAANIVIRNIPMLETNYDNMYIFQFITLLLEQNEWIAANKLYDIIKNEGDNTLITNASFLFSQYHFKRQRWQTTIDSLREAINDLPFEDHNHALLMMGISLQKLKKHRESVNFYSPIAKNSKYYIAARLNMASAYLRQGWWTDAHIVITDILKQGKDTIPEPSLNRLYLFLGYSFLNQEFFRDSREAFRNVSQSSIYTNKALLGISLSAANQEDYIGALNATQILREKESFDLTIAEAHLLTPFYHEKLQQHTTASSGYTEAISYYKSMITEIDALNNSDIDIAGNAINKKHIYSKNKINIDVAANYPAYISDNYYQLERYRPYLNKLNNEHLSRDFDVLHKAYENVIKQIIRQELSKKIQQLNSYMDQSRYGLARLYDNDVAQKK